MEKNTSYREAWRTKDKVPFLKKKKYGNVEY